MLICSVCRSQNLDSAKFCGNCGNPFSRPAASAAPTPAASTSSLVNCPQGHIYSAVYQDCPYCPQSGNLISEFATRIDDAGAPITAVDPPAGGFGLGAPSNDFATRIGADDPVFEAAEQQTAPKMVTAVSPKMPQTEVISVFSAPDTNAAPPPIAAEAVPLHVAPSAPASFRHDVEPSGEGNAFVPQPPPPPRVDSYSGEASLDGDRRTIVVTEQGQSGRASKGRIVGWLITYSHDPDGTDYRIYAGYNRIGANPVCDIVIEDETVSGSHAIIVYRDGRCLIKDDLSRNGTFVNGREISESYPLQSYDQVRVGNTYLTFIAAQRIA